jgi:mannose-6-phosphate isomerase-like protein (cupin superfamily)
MKIERNSLVFVTVSLVMAGGLAMPSAALAQDTPLSYKVSPEMYKLLAENDQFRVILQTAKPGQRDQMHSHSALAGYRLTDCTARLVTPDGKSADRSNKSGETFLLPAVAAHAFENTGKTDCVAVLVERK